MGTLFQTIYHWIDERIDLKGLQAKMFNEPVPGGARFAYAFGSCLLFIFTLQVITGILLMFYYAPTADHAWASTKYIMEEVEYGWFILSYHLWGASAMVAVLIIHMSQVFLWGAYKKPREMVWVAGTILMMIVLAFGFTGYLLPWDQRSYWATTIGVEIVDKTPLIGDFLGRFLRGGPVPGAQTLSRFFVIHVMILPLALAGVVGMHLFFFRKAGPAGPYKGTPEELKKKMDYFFPTSIVKDLIVAAGVFVITCSLAVYWPHEILEEASPEASDLDPEPEWYFLFLFQLLRDPALQFIFAGEFGEFLGAILLPGLFMALLVALPFIDRNPERNPFKRPFALGSWVVLMVTIVILTIRAIQFREQ
jgi:ubiquinol-cytochrome c reductase cytochrome b subunit